MNIPKWNDLGPGSNFFAWNLLMIGIFLVTAALMLVVVNLPLSDSWKPILVRLVASAGIATLIVFGIIRICSAVKGLRGKG